MIANHGIPRADRMTVSQAASPLPSMADTIIGWFRPLVLDRRTTTIVDREAKIVTRTQSCMGVIQPLGPRELKLKSEGERAWAWRLLHTTPDVDLKPGDEFTIGGVPYRVMGTNNFNDYGYVSYQLVENYRG